MRLRTKVRANDYVFVDGTNKGFIQTAYTIYSIVKCKLFVCTSFQAIRQSDENYMLYNRCRFVMPSWTKEEYKGAINKECLPIQLSELDEKYHYVGGSIRRMKMSIETMI